MTKWYFITYMLLWLSEQRFCIVLVIKTYEMLSRPNCEALMHSNWCMLSIRSVFITAQLAKEWTHYLSGAPNGSAPDPLKCISYVCVFMHFSVSTQALRVFYTI